MPTERGTSACVVTVKNGLVAKSILHGEQLFASPAHLGTKGTVKGQSMEESTEPWWVFLVLITVTERHITLNSALNLEQVIQH